MWVMQITRHFFTRSYSTSFFCVLICPSPLHVTGEGKYWKLNFPGCSHNVLLNEYTSFCESRITSRRDICDVHHQKCKAKCTKRCCFRVCYLLQWVRSHFWPDAEERYFLEMAVFGGLEGNGFIRWIIPDLLGWRRFLFIPKACYSRLFHLIYIWTSPSLLA